MTGLSARGELTTRFVSARAFLPASVDLQYNPFAEPSNTRVFDIKVQKARADRAEWEAHARLPFAERNCPFPELRPRRPPPAVDPDYIDPVGPDRQAAEQIASFIEEKRETLKTELIARRKQQEVVRTRGQTKREKAAIHGQIVKISEAENSMRITRSQYESDLARARRAYDTVVKRRGETAAQLKKKQAEIRELEHEMCLADEALEHFREFDAFLEKFHETISKEKLMESPWHLIEELDADEQSSLEMIAQCSEIAMRLEGRRCQFRTQREALEEEDNDIQGRIGATQVPEPVDTRAGPISAEVELRDSELASLRKVVEKAFMECTGNSADITPVMMLERLEEDIHRMFCAVERLQPSFVAEKLGEHERQRRDEARRDRQAAAEREAQRKMAAAIERAKQPVKQRTGRPVCGRMLPIVAKETHTDVRSRDDEPIERMLWGPLDYD